MSGQEVPKAETPSVPVLIVGAGPAGLTTAIMLAHQGITSMLIEQRTDPSDLPRATVISTRSMELFRSWGLESRMHAGSVDVTSAVWRTTTLASAEGSAMPIGLPDRAQAAAISPTGPVWAPQDHLESVLLTHLRTHRATTAPNWWRSTRSTTACARHCVIGPTAP